jgi:hypothetical protein
MTTPTLTGRVDAAKSLGGEFGVPARDGGGTVLEWRVLPQPVEA